MTINGVYSAIVTPFDANGEISWPDFEKLLDHQIAGGLDGVVVSGTTGESPTITVQEKLAIIRKARAYLPENIKVMAGTGGNNTAQSVELSRLADEAGADSLLVVTPPYNKPSLEGLKLHFNSIAKVSKKPICLYHVPSRTGQLLSPQEISAICSIEGVTSVKEASGDVALFSRAAGLTSASILSGDDPTFLGSLASGGQGVISVVANVFPRAVKSLYEEFTKGDAKKAIKIHQVMLPFTDALFSEPNPTPTKAVLAYLNLCQNQFRAPMTPVSKDNERIVIDLYLETLKSLKDLGVA